MFPLSKDTVREAKRVASDIEHTLRRKEALIHMMKGMLESIGPDNDYVSMHMFKKVLTDLKEL